MTDAPQQFQYSITCSNCGKVLQGMATNPLEHCANARDAGWLVPDITDNKPIRCPTCKALP